MLIIQEERALSLEGEEKKKKEQTEEEDRNTTLPYFRTDESLKCVSGCMPLFTCLGK